MIGKRKHMDDITLDPQVSRDGGRLTYRSLIRFRQHPDSGPLVRRLRDSNNRMTIWDDGEGEFSELRPIVERGTCWPDSTEDYLILEIAVSGPVSEAPTVKARHDLMVPAHIRGLEQSRGFAEIVRR